MMHSLLEINHLSVSFKNEEESIHAVRDLSLTVDRGQVVGLVGESGSGKSVTAMCVAGLLSDTRKTSVSGKILFDGYSRSRNERFDGGKSPKITMIFQDPYDSLNPAFTIGDQVEEVFRVQKKMDKHSANTRAIEMLEKVNIPSARTVAKQYPHQISGGMCQRVMIAIALAAEPDLLIADEPTTALDVTIQAQIMRLLDHLYRSTKTAILFITHDLGLVAQFCHVVAIMSDGQIVEQGNIHRIFKNPQHPYTKGLLNSIPVPGKKTRLKPLPFFKEGALSRDLCSFYPRCTEKKGYCKKEPPGLMKIETDHYVRCYRAETGKCHD